jgi:hypothetical protein
MSGEQPKPNIELQDRDFKLLRELFESRVMTLAHVAILFFQGKAEATKKRVHKLKAAGLIRDRPRRPSEPSVLLLCRQAFDLLKHYDHLCGVPELSITQFERRARVSDLTIRHELQVMDVKAAFAKAFASSKNLRLAEFSTWPSLHQFETRTLRPAVGEAAIVVKPDGFIRIRDEERDGAREHVFFLEVDRSTETLETLIQRAACYSSYFRSGGFAVRCGGAQSDYRSFPFRVLMVFKSVERRDNVAARLLALTPPILTQVWLTTVAEVESDAIGAIWVRPLDYQRSTVATGCAVDKRRGNRVVPLSS